MVIREHGLQATVRVRKTLLWALADEIAAYAATITGPDGQYDPDNGLWKLIARLRDMAEY